VLTRSARAQSADAEKAIAEIARFAFDYFYFTASFDKTDRVSYQ
jgi:hypothetical protein